MESYAYNSLFFYFSIDDQNEDEEDIQEWKELFEDDDIMELMTRCVDSNETRSS